MKHSFSVMQIFGFGVTAVLGVLLHFLYDLSNKSVAVAWFSAVNESIWEHMKILFFPMFVFAILEWIYFRGKYKSFWSAKLVGITIGVALIPVIYYTYTGVFGISKGWINISIYFVCAFVSFWVECKIIDKDFYIHPFMAIFVLCIIAFVFGLFTFNPPQIPLFQDPITKLYGII